MIRWLLVKNEDEDDAWLQLLGSLQCRDNHHHFVLYGEGKIQDYKRVTNRKEKEDKQANHTVVCSWAAPKMRVEIDICAVQQRPAPESPAVQVFVGRLAPWPQFNGKSASKTIMTSRILHKTKLEGGDHGRPAADGHGLWYDEDGVKQRGGLKVSPVIEDFLT